MLAIKDPGFYHIRKEKKRKKEMKINFKTITNYAQLYERGQAKKRRLLEKNEKRFKRKLVYEEEESTTEEYNEEEKMKIIKLKELHKQFKNAQLGEDK